MAIIGAFKWIGAKLWIGVRIIFGPMIKYFGQINYQSLGKSAAEVGWLTVISFLPLLINILLAILSTHDIGKSFKEKIIPGEILSYCLSFIAPSLYLLAKTHGTGYRLPFVKIFSLLTFLIYVLSLVLYLIAKNKWVKDIDLAYHELDLYFLLSLIFLFSSILFRVYSIYHGSFSNWTDERKRQQSDFNKQFSADLNTN